MIKKTSVSLKKIFAAVMLALTLVSCRAKKTENPADDGSTIKITATFYPLYVILANVTDGIQGVEISVLAPPDTGCLHDYQLTTGDMKKIEDCNILVANGSGMEDFMEKAISSKKDSIVYATEGFSLVDDNSHVWVSPTGAIHEAKKIAEGLAVLDAKNAGTYKKNAEIYVGKLEALKTTMHQTLDEFSGRRIVTFHEAFPYFAAEFNLKIESVIEREPGTSPSPRELAAQIESINSILSGGTTIALFAEPQYSSSAAEVIARETGLRVYELDPCVTGTMNSKELKDSYLIAMTKNMEVLKTALK